MQRLLLILPVFSLVLSQPDILLTKTIIGSGRNHSGSIANSIHLENLFQKKIMTYNILNMMVKNTNLIIKQLYMRLNQMSWLSGSNEYYRI